MTRRLRISAWTGLLLLSGVICGLRWRTYNQPLSVDFAIYAVTGHELNSGRYLYSDLWDLKPPAIYTAYALAEKIVGYGPQIIYFLSCMLSITVLLGIYAAAATLTGQIEGGLWAAAFWAIFSGDLKLEGNLPNTELFMNAALVWAFYLYLKARGGSNRRQMLLIGILLAAGSLFKQVSIAIALLWIMIHILDGWQSEDQRRCRITDSGIVMAIIVAAWGATGLYFYITHRGRMFYQTLFRTDLFYAGMNGSFLSRIAISMNPRGLGRFLPAGALWGFLPLVALIGLGCLYRRKVSMSRNQWLWLAYAAGVHLAVLLPGHFYNHYYQLWIPVACIGTAWAICCALPATRLIGVVTLLGLSLIEKPQWVLSADESSRLLWGEKYVRLKRLGEELNVALRPNESFFQWGHGASLYFYSKRHPPTGALEISHFYIPPIASSLAERTLQDLNEHPPELFITYKEVMPAAAKHPIFQWASQRYDLFPGTSNESPVTLWVRRGGPLQTRIRSVLSTS